MPCLVNTPLLIRLLGSFYPFFGMDCDMSVEWLVEAIADSDHSSISVVGRVNPWERDGSTGGTEDSNGRVYADTATLRGACSAMVRKGCAALYLHSLRWPLAAPETTFLKELRAHGGARPVSAFRHLRGSF